MIAINRVAHMFPTDKSVLFRDFRAHVDGFVLVERSDDDRDGDGANEPAARVEVFAAETDEEAAAEQARRRNDANDEILERCLAASMIPIRCGQRFRIWNHRNFPLTLCFLPTERPNEMISVDLFAPR